MKHLTDEDIKYLKSNGETDEDIDQIDRAIDKTTFEVDGKKISLEQAIDILGREEFISGMERSAFHWSASRTGKNGEQVLFDTSKFFKEDNDERAEELAKYLGVDVDTLTETSENTYETEDNEEYVVLTEEEAYDNALDSIRQFIDDNGIEGFTPSFQDWIIDNAIEAGFFDDWQDESNRNYVEDIESESDSEFDNRLISEMYDAGILTEDDFYTNAELIEAEEIDRDDIEEEDLDEVNFMYIRAGVDFADKKEEFVEYLNNQEESIDYIRGMYGDRDFAKVCIENNALDVDKIAEEVIADDGVASQLAYYDGREIALDNYYAYRIN